MDEMFFWTDGMREKPLSREGLLHLWNDDMLDPDNWLEIPEFGVQPADVDFKGFADPILHPDSPNRSLAISIRSMVKVARALARAKFSRLADLNAAASSVFKKIDEGSTAPLSDEVNTAFTYWLAMSRMSVLLAPPAFMTEEMRLEAVASKGALIANWAFRGADDVSSVFRTYGQTGGISSGKVRREALDPRDQRIVDAAAEMGWPETRDGVYKRLAKQFELSTERIGQILRLALRRNAK